MARFDPEPRFFDEKNPFKNFFEGILLIRLYFIEIT